MLINEKATEELSV